MIPFLDLKAATDELRAELDDAYRRFMDSGWYVLGEEVAAFENEYAAYCEAENCVGVGTGLDALVLALRALDVGPGDEVIVPSNTYIATWLAVTQIGATIIPVEPDEHTFNIDPKRIPAVISRRTKAIIPVNLYGQPVDYDGINESLGSSRVKIIVDNAQAHGARYKSRRVGGIADIECHSFYPSKNLGAYGEAGAVTTNDNLVAERIRTLRNYGSKVRYYNDECGTNSRLDALQAAFMRVKLRHLDDWNNRRREIAQLYLTKTPEIRELTLPYVPDWAEPVWHLFVIRSARRDALRDGLSEFGILTQVHYPVPPHCSDAYRQLGFEPSDYPMAHTLAQEVLSLPIGPHVGSADAQKIVASLKEWSQR